MALLMLLLLTIFVVAAYYLGNRDFLSPLFLLCLIFWAAFCIVLFNYTNWEVKINGLFVIYVLTALISFGLGGFLTKGLSPAKNAKIKTLRQMTVSEANVRKKYPARLLLLISLACTLLYAYRLLTSVDGSGSLSDRLRRIYDNVVYNNYSPGMVFNQFREIVTAIAYVNTYRIMLKLNAKKDDKDKANIFVLLIPVVLFFGMVLVTTDRNIFLRYAIYFLCLYVLFFKENCKKKNANLKIVQRVIIIGIVFLFAFFLLGILKQYNSNLTRVIGIYAGSGLYNFNLWLEEFTGPNLFGTATFSTLNKSLNAIFGYVGIDLDLSTLNRFDVFITYQSANGYVYSSNIYSALKPYVEDFGYFGVIFFPFIIGMFYEWLYLKMKSSKYNFSWVAYCMFIYPVIFFPILDQLFGRMSLSMIYEFFWLAVFYFAIFGKRKTKAKSPKVNVKGYITNES